MEKAKKGKWRGREGKGPAPLVKFLDPPIICAVFDIT